MKCILQRSIDVCYRFVEKLPDIGPKCEILPNQGRGSGPGSNTDIIRFDFFLLSAWEYSMPYHSGLRKSQLDLGHFFINKITL